MSNRVTTIGVSLKLYLDPPTVLSWNALVAELARTHGAVSSGAVRIFVLPSAPMVVQTVGAFVGTSVGVGAQDLFWHDRGAYTGAVSGADLVALGCRYAEVGHAERRTVFGETEEVARLKLAAALRNGLVPVICVGEREEGTREYALAACMLQLAGLLEGADLSEVDELIVAYEPEWAIGAERPADASHVSGVIAGIRDGLRDRCGGTRVTILYGGSAGPGLLQELGPAVDGLFLGRSAHDPDAIATILDETLAVR